MHPHPVSLFLYLCFALVSFVRFPRSVLQILKERVSKLNASDDRLEIRRLGRRLTVPYESITDVYIERAHGVLVSDQGVVKLSRRFGTRNVWRTLSKHCPAVRQAELRDRASWRYFEKNPPNSDKSATLTYTRTAWWTAAVAAIVLLAAIGRAMWEGHSWPVTASLCAGHIYCLVCVVRYSQRIIVNRDGLEKRFMGYRKRLPWTELREMSLTRNAIRLRGSINELVIPSSDRLQPAHYVCHLYLAVKRHLGVEERSNHVPPDHQRLLNVVYQRDAKQRFAGLFRGLFLVAMASALVTVAITGSMLSGIVPVFFVLVLGTPAILLLRLMQYTTVAGFTRNDPMNLSTEGCEGFAEDVFLNGDGVLVFERLRIQIAITIANLMSGSVLVAYGGDIHDHLSRRFTVLPDLASGSDTPPYFVIFPNVLARNSLEVWDTLGQTLRLSTKQSRDPSSERPDTVPSDCGPASFPS